jgi:flagellar basal-body rod protein FlgC
MFDTLDISASGLQAQRTRMDTIAANIANINTTHAVDGKTGPYRRRFAVFHSGLGARGEGAGKAGVHVSAIKQDPAPFQERFQPGHPDADARGVVLYPNIDLSTEYVNALECSRAYEANITTMEVTKGMMNASLRLLA